MNRSHNNILKKKKGGDTFKPMIASIAVGNRLRLNVADFFASAGAAADMGKTKGGTKACLPGK